MKIPISGGLSRYPFILLFLAGILQGGRVEAVEPAQMIVKNLRVPFCYASGGERSWPIFDGKIESGSVRLEAVREKKILAVGGRLVFENLTVTVSDAGFLHIKSESREASTAFQLKVTFGEKTQTLNVRSAPPRRPLSYVADLGDDIINVFYDYSTSRFRPITKSGFDQYFRRLQAQGIGRLIVWQTPFPFAADRRNYSAEDWQRYEQQARAIIENEELDASITAAGKRVAWVWYRPLMALRLNPGFGAMLSESAAQHGIKLTASFRPFESALTKYYDIPAFDSDGRFLWGFLPLASPITNYHPDKTCFAHYRTVLKKMGRNEEAKLTVLELRNVENAAELVKRFKAGETDLTIQAADFPPIAAESFVLMKTEDGFQLRKYGEIHKHVAAKLRTVTGYSMEVGGEKTLRITGLKMPGDARFLYLSAASEAGRNTKLPAAMPVILRAKAGNRLGRLNVYWALEENDPAGTMTRIAPITPDGNFRAEFQAAQASHKHLSGGPRQISLAGHTLVIDRGAPWSVEMLDFQRPAARKMAVNQIRSLLSYPAFDEIYISTRSHVQLAASSGDGVDGIQPISHYSPARKSHHRLGIDRAYAPIAASRVERLEKLATDSEQVERITTWQPGEWQKKCQSPDSPYAWRFTRNELVARGVRALLSDLEQEFPNTRIRAVIPPSATVVNRVQAALEKMPKPDGGFYGRDYYRHIWGSLNHIPTIGEGMTLLDLTGLSVEPVFLGIRFAPDQGPFESFLRESLADLADNRGSRFRGPRSFFYEAQETLRTKWESPLQRKRERIICDLLGRKEEINEVILYEAADWTHRLLLNDPDICGHGYLDRCGDLEAEKN